ncbi:ribonuclease III [Neorickettsia sennetsu]|uniref:Ribonuclease 3 n=1 Tax=Ehrlichia sennetsu (strain ATCC VR-367 / Miyayama) TaxID=222891 RepID=Q2GCL4_EHRS3|nr:ribonuclease III [Neorickettsia sennetsu]ABD46426.1 ribonuclease III [Neorickettsia sennetsu str. Miyayama]
MELEELQSLLGVYFKNKDLLVEALTHPSVEKCPSYERLEFLGDAVLNLVIASMLYDLFPGDPEGRLSHRQSALICKNTLAMLARQMNLGDYIRLSSSEEAGGGRDKTSNLENVLEALVGAIFLDAGLETVTCFIKKRWYGLAVQSDSIEPNPKSTLQELLQAKGMKPPIYNVINRSGPAHLPIFEIEIRVDGKKRRATGKSKKLGEENAARMMLEELKAETR